ncbi:uncharacterized protein LOC109834670 [Asparagus officinalis]|uniref:uncharacterized protein LOC109834670 n=1 Tax=Asparagus officinalis TaxID=4686 RepID=UPI00098E29C2|nr:uncharacterized protein LOC109834670 [Asparagus officinalis]
MARRSDLAQKLLDDLRLRKEKMGIATSRQQSAQATSTGNSHENSRWTFRGSGGATRSSGNKNISNTEVTQMRLGTRHHRAPSFEGVSQDIVPIGKTRMTEQIGDVSMALALALSNTGKLQNIELFSNAMTGKKLSLQHGSFSFREIDGNMLTACDQFPFLTPLQIGEISRGIRQLNIILKTCTNGVVFSRDSIEIGRELLKGAIDLEESLRMLVSLQDASDYMSGSGRKNIKLLKGKEDELSLEEVNKRKLIKPKFSFDRSSKHSQHRDRQGSYSDPVEQNQMASSYPEIPTHSNFNSNNSSSSSSSLQFSYHRRSLSSGPGSKSDVPSWGHANEISHGKELRSFSRDGNFSSSVKIKHDGSEARSATEKVRIPNVVAKLMGLEELPLATPELKKFEVQNFPNTNDVKEVSKIRTDAGINKKEANKITHSATKIKGRNMLIEEKGFEGNKTTNSLELVQRKIKKNVEEQTNPDQKHLVSSSTITDMTSIDRSKEFKVTKKQTAEVGKMASTLQQIRKEKVEQDAIRNSTPEDGIQNTTSLLHIHNDDTCSEHEEAQRNKNVVPQKQRNARVNPVEPQQQSAIHRLKTKHIAERDGKKIDDNKRNKLQPVMAKKKEFKGKNAEISPSGMKLQKASSSISTVTVTRSLFKSSNTEPNPKCNRKEQTKVQSKKSSYPEGNRKSENEIPEEKRSIKVVTKTEEEKVFPLILAPTIKKPVPNPSVQKVEAIKMMRDRNKNRGTLTEENRRAKNTEGKVQNLKQTTSLLHELEHRWKERTSKAEATICSNAMKSEQHSQQTVAPLNLLSSSNTTEVSGLEDGVITPEQIVETQQEEAANTMGSHEGTIIESAAVHLSEIYAKDIDLQPPMEENKPEGPGNNSQVNSCNSSGVENIATSQVHGQGLLTKYGYILKQVLTNSRHFLNTSQAIFKIKIPISILQDSENICQYEGDSHLIDTVYELMRRKGKREEIFFSKKTPFAPAKTGCLDDLINELEYDLRSLEMPSMNEGANNDVAEYLHKMVERDIQHRNPDVNCMWDISWNSMALANIEKEEIMTDVEKHILNALINDLARDLMSVSISI